MGRWRVAIVSCGVALACAGPPSEVREMVVTATAYNSLPRQTDRQPALAASGERLRPGVRAIAVSRDLEEAGLVPGTPVEIEGLAGEWVVLDRMPRRWRRRIDVYLGTDEAAARDFGERRVRIRWRTRREPER